MLLVYPILITVQEITYTIANCFNQYFIQSVKSIHDLFPVHASPQSTNMTILVLILAMLLSALYINYCVKLLNQQALSIQFQFAYCSLQLTLLLNNLQPSLIN